MRLDGVTHHQVPGTGTPQPREAQQRNSSWLRELEAALWAGVPRDNEGMSAGQDRRPADMAQVPPARRHAVSLAAAPSTHTAVVAEPAPASCPVRDALARATPAGPAQAGRQPSVATEMASPALASSPRSRESAEAVAGTFQARPVAPRGGPAAAEGTVRARTAPLPGGAGAEGASPARRKLHVTQQEGQGADLWLRDAGMSLVQAHAMAAGLARRMRDLGIEVRSASLNGNALFGAPMDEARAHVGSRTGPARPLAKKDRQ